MSKKIQDFKRVLIAKIAWSESDYQCEVVSSNSFNYAKKNGQKESGTYKFFGHEAFNFKNFNGVCYGYIPPTSGSYPPNPKQKEDWLVIFVSRQNEKDRLHAVGWFNHAELSGHYVSREEYYSDNEDFPLDAEHNRYTYCVRTNFKNAHLISKKDRAALTISDNLKFRSIRYIGEYGRKINPSVKSDVEKFIKKVIQSQDQTEENYPKTEIEIAKKYVPPETETKKEIEEKAIAIAKGYFSQQGYHVESVENENLGWDLTCKNQDNGEELHIEVKGTSRSEYHFFLSRNEFKAMKNSFENGTKWKLFVVKNIMAQPQSECIPAENVEKRFEIEPFCYEGSSSDD